MLEEEPKMIAKPSKENDMSTNRSEKTVEDANVLVSLPKIYSHILMWYSRLIWCRQSASFAPGFAITARFRGYTPQDEYPAGGWLATAEQ